MWDGNNKKDLRKAAEALRHGELVAFPTETVYGLGANGLDPLSVAEIYRAKGRPSDNPLILHIYEKAQAYALAKEVSPLAEKVMDKFWPGPLTLILPKSDCVPDCITGGRDTVAVRMPSNPQAQAILRLSRIPIAAPSANLSGRPSGTTAQHVWEDFHDKIYGIVDGGACEVGLESTVLDLTSDTPIILRPGAVTPEMLEEALEIKVLVGGQNVGEKEVPKAPGMKYRHYAPKGTLLIANGTNDALISDIRAKIAAAERPLGLMLSTETLAALGDIEQDILVHDIGSLKDPAQFAGELFSDLRDFDDHGIKTIISEPCADESLGLAVMNRLTKAAGGGQKV